jgi:hypothetical protein
MNEQNSGHWWEFYGVRYAQGTVVGAMIVFFLFSQNEALKKILFIPSDPKYFGMPHLILLAVYGLAYCYIASAPILILHAQRGLLFKSPINPNPSEGAISRRLWVLLPSLVITVIYYCFSANENKIPRCSAVFLYIMLISMQINILFDIFLKSWKKTIDYYLVIVEKRDKYKNSSYVESYKHIREHGNSFLIVLFQFLLAFIIFVFVSEPAVSNADSIRYLLIIVPFWVAPAAIIWLFGNKLENNLQFM